MKNMRINKSQLRGTALSLLFAGVTAMPAAAGVSHGEKPEIGTAGTAAQVTRVVQVNVQDNYFEPESLQVRPGDTVKFIIVNQGEFLHEFNIGTPDMHAKHQKEMAMMMEHGMLNMDGMGHSADSDDHAAMQEGMDHGGMDGMSMDHDDPNSVLIAPGETKELIWTFAEVGGLEFGCNVPGHYESGMVGTFSADTSAN